MVRRCRLQIRCPQKQRQKSSRGGTGNTLPTKRQGTSPPPGGAHVVPPQHRAHLHYMRTPQQTRLALQRTAFFTRATSEDLAAVERPSPRQADLTRPDYPDRKQGHAYLLCADRHRRNGAVPAQRRPSQQTHIHAKAVWNHPRALGPRVAATNG